MIWEYLAEIISPTIQDGDYSIAFLPVAAKACTNARLGGKFISALLRQLQKNKSSESAQQVWQSSGLSLASFLSPEEDVKTFAQKEKLEFLFSSEEPAEPVDRPLTAVDVRKQLDLLMKQPDNQPVFDWIESKGLGSQFKEPAFIRALVTSVCESVIKHGAGTLVKLEEEKLKSRTPLLLRFLENSNERELQALYALQALVTRLEHPKGVLRELFNLLYDEDVISEEAFRLWEQSEDPAEQEGKGVALKSVVQFFTWLTEAEVEGDSNEES
jgi:translation initiation factor 4G